MDSIFLALAADDPVDRIGAPPRVAEDAVLESARTGDRSAFETLVRLNQASVFSLALRLLRVHEDAQELAQDVFMALHRHIADIESLPHLRFWLRRTTCHRAIDRLRRRPKEAQLPLDAALDVESTAQDTDLLLDQHLRRLIAQLPAVPQAVVLLRYQEDLDPPQIAATLGLPLNTIKSHLKRSLALLRTRCTGLMRDCPQERTP